MNKTISTMESCTGGGVANVITNVPGASSIFEFSAVTYSNDFKIKMGVSSDIIDKYSVYSLETAREMARNISNFSGSDLGIGITGKLGSRDLNNPSGDNDMVFICVYDNNNDKYYDLKVKVNSDDRIDDKDEVIDAIFDFLERYV